MTRWKTEEQIVREMAERGWKVSEIRKSLRMPSWWVRRVLYAASRPPRVPPIERPGVREALKGICDGTRHQDIYDAHGAAAFQSAFRLWRKGERL